MVLLTKFHKNKIQEMVLFPSIFDGLARSVSVKKGRNSQKDVGKEAAEALAKNARKNELMLSSSGIVKSMKSNNFASVCSKRGQKGINQDCFIVWEEFGCQEDMIFCGIFDGHGPWGHVVAKRVKESVPSSLLCNWQETLALTSLDMDFEMELDRNLHQFDIWKQSYLKTYATVDQELKQHPEIDAFSSGSTALTIVKQGEHLVIANVGDSRAVLATISDDGSLASLQLTTDFKPNLPQEAERITQSNGRVFCLHDEPGVYRVWMPDGKRPGLALSRAFGDYCVKDFGLISIPDVTQRSITSRDQFVILATDGLWDVISNQEAVQIVSSTPDRQKAAKRLVQSAVRAWKYKKRGLATDDISAICLFFRDSLPQEVGPLMVLKQA
ncbi:probable protein phosphatase 2C 34 isoform X2 [Ricinus communis]|uniref:probable protein phosphatase 2C 34 isoform X2 n=1 Tax=Ricinus communis TaxID=3988 RepID=UPI000772B763|nr:probable protein phosphatase 2C 34 isoform X2 [Ricinus communis]|eukprot:XP_002516975.2 probable protein phosphatase 2C 34 isoform X2 [Ricinus communis]